MAGNLRKLTFLHVLLIMLGIAGFVRLADFTQAVADPKAAEKIEPAAGEPAKNAEADAEAKTAIVDETPAEPSLDELTDADIGVLEQLSERRKQLDDREKKLVQREALLKAASAELNTKYKELQTLQNEIKKLLGQQSEAEEARLKSLVKTYEGMKPGDAANILNTLDIKILMQLMGRMSERKMSPILAAMNPERAREVTTKLAEQKKLPDAAPPADPLPVPGTAAAAPDEVRTMDKSAAEDAAADSAE